MSTLEDQVGELRAELTALRNELATEVRTRRLVVVDDDGFERLATQHSIDAFEVFIASKNVDGAHVKLYAGEEGGESQTMPTAALTVRGLRGAVELESPSEGDARIAFETIDDDVCSLSWHDIGSLERRLEALRKFVIVASNVGSVAAEQYAEAVEQ